MGAICSSNAAVAKQEVFDPKDYMLVSDYDMEIAKSSEQKNLLRFKVEVLINMLAIEEKKMGSLTKRIEALKWTMLSKGVTEDGLDNIFKSLPDVPSKNDGQKTSPGKMAAALDFGGAIQRLAAEFVTNKKDIVQSFADDEGKVVTTLNRDEFMRQLYAATEHVSKADIQAISLRFFDGTTVSIVEFIEFFMTPNAVRQAKAAAAAVRMSLDLLQLEQNTENREDPFIDDDDETDNEDRLALTSSHNTRSLDLGTSSLSVMWPLVDLELEDLFFSAEDLGDQIVLLQTFKKMLTTVCGEKSKILKAAQSSSQYSELKPLETGEIDILAERFEIGGRVHFGHFLQFFREMSQSTSSRPMSYKAVDGSVQTRSSRPKPNVGISPFRMSSEWAALKADAVKEKEMEMSRRDKEYELNRKERERESFTSDDKEKEMFKTEMNAIDDRLSLLSADNKSGKGINKGIGYADEGRGDKTGARTSLGVGGAPRAMGVQENIQRNKEMFPENFAESKVMLSPSKPFKFDSKGSSMSSPISRSPDSKVAFNLGGNNTDLGDNTRNNGSGQKPVRSILGQYEEVMADNEQAISKESDSKNRMKDGRNRTGSGSGSGSPGQHRLTDLGSENDVKNSRKSGNRNGLGESDAQGSSESKEIRNNNTNHKNLPENIPGNRKSWGQSLGMFAKKNPRNDNDDIEEVDTLKRPQRAMSPLPAKGRGVTRLLSWGKRTSNDGSSPVAL